MHSPYSYYPSSSSNASESDGSPSLSKRRTVENSIILSRKYPRSPSQPPVGRDYNQIGRAQGPPVRNSADSLVERGYNQTYSTPNTQFSPNNSLLPGAHNLPRAQSPAVRVSDYPSRLRSQSPPPSLSRPSNQLLPRAQSPPPTRLSDYPTVPRAQSPPARSLNQPRAHSPFSKDNQPPVIPPKAPNVGYLREQYSPKPLKKILRKPWGKSKSVDIPYIFPYTPPPPKTSKDNSSYLFSKLSNLRSKSPSPRSQDINKRVQFLDVPPDAAPLVPQRRSRSPIRAVANFFKKPGNTPKERPRSNSVSRFVRNIGNKIHSTPTTTFDGYTSDSSITPHHKFKDDLDAGYVSDSNTRKLSVPTSTSSIKNTFRKFSQGTVNFAKSLKPSNERLADNLNDYEWTKQNLLRSSELLNKSTERFSSLYSGGSHRTGVQESGLTNRNEKVKVSKS